MATAGLTAFYMWRLMNMTFYGKSRVAPEVEVHIHESPASMTVPLTLAGRRQRSGRMDRHAKVVGHVRVVPWIRTVAGAGLCHLPQWKLSRRARTTLVPNGF